MVIETCPAQPREVSILEYAVLVIPAQAFYSIQIQENDMNNEPKTYPSLLTIKERVVNEDVIDAELKHLFKGKSG
jgi:hypothetical protein